MKIHLQGSRYQTISIFMMFANAVIETVIFLCPDFRKGGFSLLNMYVLFF